jgi:hypothetical protein
MRWEEPLFQIEHVRMNGGKMRKLVLFAVATLATLSGCFLEGGLGPGGTEEAEITEASPRLDQAMTDPEAALLEAGVPVEAGFNCVRIKLKSGGNTVIQAAAVGSFDPVTAVVDGDGEVLAVNDDWAGAVDSRIVLAEVPSGSSLLVWGVNGGFGTATVSVEEGTSGDLEEWSASATLLTGFMSSSLVPGKEDDTMDDLVRDLRASDIYVSDWLGAVLVPFSVVEEGYRSITLTSGDFDTYMALVSLDRGRARFLAANDDSGADMNSKLLINLEPGIYGILVNSYSGSDTGDFELSVQPVEVGQGRITWVEIPGAASEEIVAEDMAMAYWPGIDEGWNISGITAATPAAGFGFVVEQAGMYRISAFSELDCTLTLLGYESPEEAYCIDYNDDSYDWNPSLALELEPGTYLALVAPYDGTSETRVEFSVEPEAEFIPDTLLLRPGDSVELSLDGRIPYGLFALDIVGGYNYSVSAESELLDPVMTLTFVDGSEIYDDDGGENFNSYAEFVPTAGQLGEAVLKVETYSGGGNGTVTVSFQRLGRLSEADTFSLYD